MQSLSPKPHHTALSLQQWLRGLACVALIALLTACGFKLKGISPLPFNTLYTNIQENSAFGAQVRRAITASSPNTHFVSDPTQADAKLIQLSNTKSLREVSLNAQGQIEDYELNLAFTFQLTDGKGHLVLPPTTLEATREIPYDSSVLQAKEGEIGSLFTEMQQGLVDRMVRRLTSPGVLKAYRDAGDLPAEEQPATTEPLSPDDQQTIPTPFRLPNTLNPGAGLY